MISLLAHEAIVRISYGIPSAIRHPSSSAALHSSFSRFSRFLSALLAAVNPLSSAGRNDTAIGGTLSHAVPVLVNLWMSSTEAKSYRYRAPHEWPAIRKSSAVVRVRKGYTRTVDVRARARVALSERTCGCARSSRRASLCAPGGIKEVKRTRDCHRRWV